MEKAGIDADVARLTRLERSYHDDQRRLRSVLDKSKEQARIATERADELAVLLERVTDTRGDAFVMTVDGQRFDKRADAGNRLIALLQRQLSETPAETTTDFRQVAELAGLPIEAQTTTAIENEIRLRIPGTAIKPRIVEHQWHASDPTRLIQGLERRIQHLPEAIDRLRADAQAAMQEAERAQARVGQPWEHTDQLTRLRCRQQELDEDLSRGDDPGHPDSEPPQAGTVPVAGAEGDSMAAALARVDDTAKRAGPEGLVR